MPLKIPTVTWEIPSMIPGNTVHACILRSTHKNGEVIYHVFLGPWSLRAIAWQCFREVNTLTTTGHPLSRKVLIHVFLEVPVAKYSLSGLWINGCLCLPCDRTAKKQKTKPRIWVDGSRCRSLLNKCQFLIGCVINNDPINYPGNDVISSDNCCSNVQDCQSYCRLQNVKYFQWNGLKCWCKSTLENGYLKTGYSAGEAICGIGKGNAPVLASVSSRHLPIP